MTRLHQMSLALFWVASLAAGIQHPLAASLALLLAIVWWAALWRSWPVAADLAWLGLAGLHAALLFNRANPYAALAGLVLSLAAWDLFNFGSHLSPTRLVHDFQSMVYRHVRLLVAVLAAAGTLAAVALGLQLQLSFIVAVALVLVAYLAIGRLISYQPN